eukprot:symbB.v1.2.020682.t1/scaffold1757.1/size102910/6
MAKHMPGLMHLFYGRTFLLHQEQLQENPHRVFNSIAKFLGVTRSFPEDTKFPRYNSIGGYRTDLCYNTTLVRELQEHMEPEYLMQEAILRAAKVSIPPSLRLRRTRCHNLATAEALMFAHPPTLGFAPHHHENTKSGDLRRHFLFGFTQNAMAHGAREFALALCFTSTTMAAFVVQTCTKV